MVRFFQLNILITTTKFCKEWMLTSASWIQLRRIHFFVTIKVGKVDGLNNTEHGCDVKLQQAVG